MLLSSPYTWIRQWRPELECTELPIQVFTDHQALKTFMENKQLTRRQANYLDILVIKKRDASK